MKNKEILKNDELITKFIGRQGKVKKDLYTFIGVSDINNGDPWFTLEHAKFHYSWDWLMPVLNKIMDICFSDDNSETYDSELFYQIRDCIPEIHHTYSAIIEFINQYNKNK